MPYCSSLCLRHPARGLAYAWSSGNEWCSWCCSGPHWTSTLLLHHILASPFSSWLPWGRRSFFLWVLHNVLILNSVSSLAFSGTPWMKALGSLLFPWPIFTTLESGCMIAAPGASLPNSHCWLPLHPPDHGLLAEHRWLAYLGSNEQSNLSCSNNLLCQPYQVSLNDSYSQSTCTGGAFYHFFHLKHSLWSVTMSQELFLLKEKGHFTSVIWV